MKETDALDEYILRHIDEETDYLKALYRDTHVKLLRPRMASGHLQGRMLKMFVRMIRPKQVLEIGTYSGYSALCLAEGLEEGAMLHDIGIFKTSASGICCDGDKPYICHGYLGSELLQAEGLPRHALVAERHTGTGLSLKQIIEQNLPVPHRDMRPVSIEEQIICFADKFFSKTHLGEERDFEQARRKLEKFGEESLNQFDKWGKMFL